MVRAEWTITARSAVLRLAQMKYRYFVPECCKQVAQCSNQGRGLHNIWEQRVQQLGSVQVRLYGEEAAAVEAGAGVAVMLVAGFCKAEGIEQDKV